MQYHLFALGAKNLPNPRLVFSGTHAQVNKELTARRRVDTKTEYAVYDDGNRLLSSTFGGGANPHAWDTRASGKSRKLSGLSAARR